MSIRYGLLAAPGLGSTVEHEIALREIKLTNPSGLWLRNHDLLLSTGEKSTLRELLKIRTVDDIFVILEENIEVKDKQHLKRLIPRTLRSSILEAIPLLPPRRQKRITTHFAIFVKQDADHEVYRREIEKTIGAYLLEQFARWKVSDPADIEFWAFYIKGRVTLGLRLTRTSFRQRRYREDERPGSLRPTIAAALVALSNPESGDIVLDPMCGAGTVLLERGLWDKNVKLIGCDIDTDAVDIGRSSADKAGLTVDWRSGDAANTDLLKDLKGSVSRIICNLPFGKAFQNEDVGTLYSDVIKSWKPLLKRDGKMILLTPHEKTLRDATKRAGLSMRQIEKIRVKGLEALVFEVGNKR